MTLQFRPLCYALGAEVIGIDIRSPIAPDIFSEIYQAFLKYSALLFRGTPVTREQHIAFSRYFGEVDNNDRAPRIRLPDYHEIQIITSKIKTTSDPAAFAGQVWHSDQSYSTVPAKATLLHALQVPTIGGDTMVANMYLAYESLSATMQKIVEGLHAVHFGGKARLDNSTPERAAETARQNLPTAHPLVQVHPETGRKSLFVGGKVKQIVDMHPDESTMLLKFLCEHAARSQFMYRHQWQKDDVLVWDNRCTNHIGLGDYDRSQQRNIDRTTVIGLPGGYPYTGPVHYQGPRL
jgi:taurine dioxygenase